MNRKYVCILPLLLITGCDISKFTITTYDDCIIENIKGSPSEKVIEAIKVSCKKKFPATFDFSDIAKKANVMTWDEIALSEKFKKHSQEEKEELKNSYFFQVIERRVHPDFIEEARTEFQSHVWAIDNDIRKIEGVSTKPNTSEEKSRSLK